MKQFEFWKFFFLCVSIEEEEGGILDLVVSALTGEDDDESEKTKTEVRYFKLVWLMVYFCILSKLSFIK